MCKDCGGSSICQHGRQRSMCKDCGGSGLCQHGRLRSKCNECLLLATLLPMEPQVAKALVLGEARQCSLTRLRNLVKKQDPSVAWYVFGRKKAQDWLADNATIAVFGLKIKKT